MQEIQKAHVDDPLETMEMTPEDVLEGDPQSRSKVLFHVPGDATRGLTGIFAAEPGKVRTTHATHETFHVVEGRAHLEHSSGESVTMKAGDIVVLVPGDWTFTFETSFRCIFVSGPV